MWLTVHKCVPQLYSEKLIEEAARAVTTSVQFTVSFFSTHCFMRVREFWTRSSLKGDPDEFRLVKIWSWRFKNLEARKQKQTTTYIISEFPSSPELIWPRTSGHLGLAADQRKKEKRWQNLVQFPHLATNTNRKQATLWAPAGKWCRLMPVKREDLSSVNNSGRRQKTKAFQAELVK